MRPSHLLALTLLAGCWKEPAPEPWEDPGTSDEFLGFDLLLEVELQLEPDAVDSLRTDPRVYVEGTLVFEGQRFGPLGVRLKGQNSFQPFDEKPSFRINVNEYIESATFYELKDLTFNNMASDPSQMHERLAYRVAREAGIPASRSNHILLTVNGEFYGVYANVETVKPRMLRGWFDDNNGPLFEATDVDFSMEYVDGYELDAGPDDRSMLVGLARALELPSAEDALAAAAEFIDLAHFQRYWATSSVIGQFDSFPYSLPGDDYYLYADPTSRQLWIIPWGMDETFFAADFSPLLINSVLARRCMEVPSCFDAYVAEAWDVLALTEEIGLEADRARIEAELAPHIARDTRRPFSDAEVTEGQTQLGYFIRGRRESLGWYLPPP